MDHPGYGFWGGLFLSIAPPSDVTPQDYFDRGIIRRLLLG